MRKLLLLSAVVSAFIFASPTAQAAGCGKAEVVKGDAQIKRAGAAPAALKVEDKICQGDEVVTAKDSRVKVAMEDGNILNINPSSAIKIEAYENNPDTQKKKVLLNVMYGKMRATVKQKYTGASNSGEAQTFQVKTKTAVAGVRGTDFLTSFDRASSKMSVVTFEGRVEVGQMGANGAIVNSVFVNPGFSTEATKASGAVEPKMVPKEELNKMDSSSSASLPATGASDVAAGPAASEPSKKEDKAKSDEPARQAAAAPIAEGKKEAPRAPSSVAMPSLMPPPVDVAGPPIIGLPALPPMPVIPVIPKCDFCDQRIQNGAGKLKVNVCVRGVDC